MELLKECILDCYYSHEGHCICFIDGLNPNDCKAKTNDDLVDGD